MNWSRVSAMVFKEARQAARDPGTIAMMFLMPIMQLLIFGFAINNDPRHLPLAIEANDNSAVTRSITAALGNTGYFEVRNVIASYGEGERLIASGKVQFVVTIPPDFTRDLVRGVHPELLVTADASDPAATGPALNAISEAVNTALAHDLIGALGGRMPAASPVQVIVHKSYNPEGITSHNTVPGLLAIILSMTMVMQTAMSVTREVEQGTMENLLATPLRPVEVMIGKIVPYLLMGMVQMVVVLTFAALVFHVPFAGSLILEVAATLLFIAVSLALGFTFSTLATSQLQAMQLSFFYMLPSILLSGFAFPFRGMPRWAQLIAELLPTTHYIRLVRGIMLKGWTLTSALPQLGILGLMLLVLGFIAVRRYQDTIA
ncbi:MAG: ABC transporter permease [Novosphingobium sp.]